MKITNNLFKLFLFVSVLSLSSCETLDLDQTDNPSTLPASKLDPVYVFNSVQLSLPDYVKYSNSFTQRVTRQFALTNGTSYDNAFAPVDFDNNWTTGWLMLNAIKSMEPKATENQQYFILGASKVIRCYVLMTMVDMYGNIPYSEALQGNANLTPKYDDSEAVYEGIYNELNDAITLLGALDNTDGFLKARDLYYGTGNEGTPSAPKWIILANTLKFKMLNSARLSGSFGSIDIASEMANLLSDPEALINSPSEDFAFKYGTERDLPNSRHPQYNDHYELGTGAYIANYFFWAVSEEKGSINDPREKYYFFKQKALTNMSDQELPCNALPRPAHFNNDEYASFYNQAIKAPYCVSNSPIALGSAYLGRDHGDASGLPADSSYRTVVGVYPAGGLIGDSGGVVNDNINAGLKGGLGEGIMPMVLSSYVHFMKAEALLMVPGLSGDPRAELESAIRESITKTTTLLPQYVPGQPNAPSASTIASQTTSYLNFVLGKYDISSQADKLQIIIKEYYIAAWGNGIEPYNSYRRTGYPSNFQPTVEENPGDFYSTALYAGASVNNNPKAPNNVRTKKVFWDSAAIDLH
jgi:hypothetical protein